jgi:hypothetical protein
MPRKNNAHKGLCYGQTGQTVILSACWYEIPGSIPYRSDFDHA